MLTPARLLRYLRRLQLIIGRHQDFHNIRLANTYCWRKVDIRKIAHVG